MGPLALYKRFAGIAMRSQMQYKASFLLTTLAHGLTTAGSILAIWVLFSRFRGIDSWSFAEVALLYGIVHTSFGLAEGLGRGFDTFGVLVKAGEFDRFLLRPCSVLLQVASREVQLLRLGRVIQGLCVLIYGIVALNLYTDAFALTTLLCCLVGATALFFGLFIIQATLCFWSTESLELMNILTFGGVEAGQYPLSIYKRWLRDLLTFIVPIGCVAFLPVSAILGKGEVGWFALGTPLFGLLFLWISMRFWECGVRRYTSTGS